MWKYVGYLTGTVTGALLSLLLVTSIAVAEVGILELTKTEAIEVLNDRIPNARMTGEFNVGEFMIGHMTSYLPPHSYSPVYMNSKVRFDVAKNKTERGCVLSIAAVSIIGQELTPPLRIGICFNGLTIKLYFKK